MASYSKVERRVWRDEKVRTWSRDTRELWHYLLTCPHMEGAGGKVGMYVLDQGYAAADLSTPDHRWTADQVQHELERLESLGRILWDQTVNLVLLVNFLRQDQNHPDNPNVAKRAAIELEELPYSETLWKGLAERLQKYTKLRTSNGSPWCSHIVGAIRNRVEAETDAKGLREPFTARNTNVPADPTDHANGKGYGNPSRARRRSPEPEPEPEPSIHLLSKALPGSSKSASPGGPREGRPGRSPGRKPRADRKDQQLDGWQPDTTSRKTAQQLGKDLEFEVREFRRANQRHDTELRNPDAAFMAWLKKPAKTVPTPVPGSEAEAARAQETGNEHRAGDRLQQARHTKAEEATASRVRELEQAEPEHAGRIRAEVQRQVDEDPNWGATPEGVRARVADTLYRRRLIEELAP